MKKILIVDDDPYAYLITETPLVAAGYQVKTAENGQLGVSLALEWQPDLIVMDVEMPVMDGISALKVLRKSGYRGKIVVLTGHSGEGNTVSVMKAGADHILVKPLLCNFVDAIAPLLGDQVRGS